MKKPSHTIKFFAKTKTFIEKTSDILCIDPCYLFKDGAWEKICEVVDAHRKENAYLFGTILFDGVEFLFTQTAYGDGAYKLKSNKKTKGYCIGVDSGLICFVPKFAVERKMKIDLSSINNWMVIEDFTGELRVDGKWNLYGDHKTQIKHKMI
jgi:hypothetical protein